VSGYKPGNAMARQRRFECYIEFWTTPQQAEAFDALQASSLLTKSDLYRLAFDNFLRQQGVLPARPMQSVNGHQETSHGLRT
jgi:hypothetical protein